MELNYTSPDGPTNVTFTCQCDVEKVETFCSPISNNIDAKLCNVEPSDVHRYYDPYPKTLLTLGNNAQYLATDGKTIYKTVKTGTFLDDGKGTYDTPKLNVSGFDRCPHFYGTIYWKGETYEIHQKMTEEFLEEGRKSGGDWTGYKVGEFTKRFISMESLRNAFELIKMMME